MSTKRRFEPLEIKFEMSSPICIAHPWLHFDGIIARLLLRKILGDNFRALPSKSPINLSFVHDVFPIKKYNFGNNFFYYSSVSIFDNEDYFKSTIYKRFYEKGLSKITHQKTKKIRRGSGKYKDFMISLVNLSCKNVIFYANGDKREIESLLESLSGIGKKTSSGYGQIKNFEVKTISVDYSIIKDGLSMRPIPIEAIELQNETNIEQLNLAYIFPYWAKKNVCLCAPPYSKIKLKNNG